MTIEEIGALANILRELKIVLRDFRGTSTTSVVRLGELVDMYKDYQEIFVGACEINRERIKHILKK